MNFCWKVLQLCSQSFVKRCILKIENILFDLGCVLFVKGLECLGFLLTNIKKCNIRNRLISNLLKRLGFFQS